MQTSTYLRLLQRMSSLLLAFFILVSATGAQEHLESPKIVQPEIGPPEVGPPEIGPPEIGPPEVFTAEPSVPPVEQQPILAGPEPEPESTPAEQAAEWNSPVSALLKVGGGIGIVIGLILGGFWAMKRIAPQYFAKRASGKMLRLIETLSMGEKRAIAIVEVAGTSYLIGNAPGQITLLAALQHLPAAADEEKAAPQQEQKPQKGSFLDLYEAAKSTPIKAVRPVEIPPDIRGKMRELRQALER